MMIETIRKNRNSWALALAMVVGAAIYYIIDDMPMEVETMEGIYHVCTHWVQPCLIFAMLTLSFLKVRTHDMMPHKWHFVLLATQGSLFVACALIAMHLSGDNKIIVEGAMLCFICPTATASAVIVQKLGGSLSGCVTYLILCNLMVSLLAPAFLTLVEPHASLDFATSFFMIMGKVFPLLLCPLFVAMIVRNYLPKLADKMLMIPDLAFYLWLVALALAITVTVRTIAESDIRISILTGLAIVSLVSCLVQFMLGRRIGGLTAGQAFGQKNTVFAIWMGLVFLNPITSVTGGFYSVWHNIVNAWQLSRKS